MPKKKRKRLKRDKTEVPMSAMIDVVFLLLIFFIATNKPKIPEAHVAINLPSPTAGGSSTETPTLLEVHVHPGNQYLYQGKNKVTPDELEEKLKGIAAFDTEQTVIIKMHPDATESSLMTVLDKCNSAGLNKLNVMMLAF